jgi:hypothetical protein
MDARRDALAHRFIARTLDETREWPAELQLMLQQLAFVALPELVLALDAEAACTWVRAWRARVEEQIACVDPAEVERAMARSEATPAAPDDDPSPTEITRLAELLARFGPLALALPWRDGARGPIKA